MSFPFPVSIGFDLPKDVYVEHLVSSQFCLVIRGDTPHSHALLSAIQVGCIPVVISTLRATHEIDLDL